MFLSYKYRNIIEQQSCIYYIKTAVKRKSLQLYIFIILDVNQNGASFFSSSLSSSLIELVRTNTLFVDTPL